MSDLTPRQTDVLNAVGEFIDAFGYGPSYRNIAQMESDGRKLND